MKTPLLPNEVLVKEGAANLQRGLETVGGRLYLTSLRLVFESHRFNIQRGPSEVALSEVEGVERRWTKFLGLIPLMPNAMAVRTREGIEHRFTLWGRAAWIAAVEGTRGTGD